MGGMFPSLPRLTKLKEMPTLVMFAYKCVVKCVQTYIGANAKHHTHVVVWYD